MIPCVPFQIIAFDELRTDFKSPIDECNPVHAVSGACWCPEGSVTLGRGEVGGGVSVSRARKEHTWPDCRHARLQAARTFPVLEAC